EDLRPIVFGGDWRVDENHATVFHRPSKLLFRIDCPSVEEGARVPLAALSARILHVCDGAPLPATPELLRIGKDAIHVFVICADIDLDVPRRPFPPSLAPPPGSVRSTISTIKSAPSSYRNCARASASLALLVSMKPSRRTASSALTSA